MNFVKGKIQHKLTAVINILIIFMVLVASIIIIYNKQQELIESMIEKQYTFGRFATGSLIDHYQDNLLFSKHMESFRKIGGLEYIEGKELPESLFDKNEDIIRYLIIRRNGEIIFDSEELRPEKGIYPKDEPPRIAPVSIRKMIRVLKPNSPSLRFVKLDNNIVLEVLAPKTLPSGEHIYATVYYVSLEKINNTIFNTTLLIILLSIAIIIIASIVSVLISKSIVRPIHELEKASKTIAEGDYTVKANVKTSDEIGRLAKTFNSMAGRVREYSEHLEDMVAKRTDELNKTNKELTKKNKIMMKELDMAKRVQENILPSINSYPKRDKIDVVSSYSAMESIGGDLYDIMRVGRNAFGFLMADVSGHGVPAALITTMVKVSFNTHTGWKVDTSETCNTVNKEMIQFIGDLEYYLTAYYCKLNLETGEFQYTNCGHHPAILYRKRSRQILPLDTDGCFIGAFEEVNYETKSVMLEEGDRILMFTDGVNEARNAEGDFYGYDRLMSYIENNSNIPTKEFVDGLIKDVEKFCKGHPADDDRAIMYFEFVSKITPDKSPTDSIHIEAKKIRADEYTELEEDKQQEVLHEEYKEAMNYIKNKEYEKARDILLSMKKEFSDNLKIINNLATVYYRLGEYQEAYNLLYEMQRQGKISDTMKKNLQIIRKKLEKTNTN